MLDAVVGTVIMVIATTSLLSAVEVVEKAFADAGRQELSMQEYALLCRLQKQEAKNKDKNCSDSELERDRAQFRKDSILTLPRQVIQTDSE